MDGAGSFEKEIASAAVILHLGSHSAPPPITMVNLVLATKVVDGFSRR